MTMKQALADARRRFGKAAAVKKTPKGGYIGAHGEYVCSSWVRQKDGTHARAGHYFCAACSVGDDRVYHQPGAAQTSFAVGTIGLGIFFMVEGQGDSWSAAFAAADAKAQRARDEYAAMKAAR